VTKKTNNLKKSNKRKLKVFIPFHLSAAFPGTMEQKILKKASGL
jgi:hypothetical protein